MKILLTGGAGFIGSNLTKFLLDKGHSIVTIDDFSLGKKEYIQEFLQNPNYKLVQDDLLNMSNIKQHFRGVDLVIHLAANSDIWKGEKYTDIDLKNGTIVTYNVLECMREYSIKKLIFASSITIFGLMDKFPIGENDGPIMPISLYAASKLACEGLISAYSHNYDIQSWIYRNANVIGRNPTHGAAYNFACRLKDNAKELVIWGDGKQEKPYIYVDDLIEGMWHGYTHANNQLNYFNLTTTGSTTVTFLGKAMLKYIGSETMKIIYTGDEKKRKGDVIKIEADNKKLKKLGRKLTYENSNDAVVQGTKDVLDQIYFRKK